MSFTVKWPVANTIAFGGVATGSINANDAAITHGNIKYRGFKPSLSALKRDSVD